MDAILKDRVAASTLLKACSHTAALRQQSERAELDLIRRRLKLPISKRMNFLRVRLPGGGSHL